MIRLIVNADDLGSGSARDRGIFAARERGVVSSASLLANGPSFATAARTVRETGLPVGVHLNLSEGPPLTGPIPGLTDATGVFSGKITLRKALHDGAFDRSGTRRELLAQIDRVRSSGIIPDHLDTHQHCLLFPALTGIIADVAGASGIRALRLPLPAEPVVGQPGAADCAAGHVKPFSPGGAGTAVDTETGLTHKGVHSPQTGCPTTGFSAIVANELALYRQLAPAVRDTLHARQLWTPDGLWGMPLLNRLNETALMQTLAALPAGSWELMTHPGFHDPADPFGGPERETEVAALTAPAIRTIIIARGIELTSFGACACAC